MRQGSGLIRRSRHARQQRCGRNWHARDRFRPLGNLGDGLPADLIVTLGYSGWGAGQLEHEIADNAWLTVPADAGIIFDQPHENRLPAALERLGVDFARLAEKAGHA